MKMKTRPTERENKRYILIEASDKAVVEKAIMSFIGTLGFSEAAPSFVEMRQEMKAGQHVLSINREKLEQVRAAVELSKDKIRIIKVSGTLKGLFS